VCKAMWRIIGKWYNVHSLLHHERCECRNKSIEGIE